MQNSAKISEMITELWETFRINSRKGRGVSSASWAWGPSPVSKSWNPVWLGWLRTNFISTRNRGVMAMLGMRNTHYQGRWLRMSAPAETVRK